MPSLTYYYSQNDPERLATSDMLRKHCEKHDLVFIDICIEDQPEIKDKYAGKTPAICIGPYVLYSPFTETDLEVATKSALTRHERLIEEGDQRYQQRLKNGLTLTRLDRFSYFFSRYYALVISIFLAVFILIPFFAPVLEHEQHPGAANVIYKTYRIICHQLAFRSFFLYGIQPFYPRELAHVDGYMTYEEITGSNVIDLEYARDFIGNNLYGYKVAICERDVAIYGSLALFGFLFHLTGKKIKTLKWYWWFILALIPIGLDGASQIPSLSAGWPAWMPIRESTPLLRVLTGTLFGTFTGWYMYPMMEESMKETRITLHRKITMLKKLAKESN